MSFIDKKRLAVDIPEDMHNELKAVAQKYNITITAILVDMINQLLIHTREHDKTNEVKNDE